MSTQAAKIAQEPAMANPRLVVLTGFDAPCLHTMYLDKPMRGHGLMQAIARVNRLFNPKKSPAQNQMLSGRSVISIASSSTTTVRLPSTIGNRTRPSTLTQPISGNIGKVSV